MTKITYSKARAMLREACARYIEHNKSELNKSVGVRTYRVGIFPKPIYGPWLSCIYEHLLEGIYRLDFNERDQCSLKSIKAIHNSYAQFREAEHFEHYHYGQLKGLGHEARNGIESKIFDCDDNALFLHNLLVLNRLLYQVVTHRDVPNSEYSLSVKKDDSIIEKNKLYIRLRKKSDRIKMFSVLFSDEYIAVPDYLLEYTFVNSAGQIATAPFSLDSIFSYDPKAYVAFVDKPLSEESLSLLKNELRFILEITSKRGHTHYDTELTEQLQHYRVQQHPLSGCLETIPLGWYMFPINDGWGDSSKIGNRKEWTSIHQFRVMPPINTIERPIKRDEYLWCVHFPYIESKQGSLYPISVQVNDTLTNLKSLIGFMGTLPQYVSGKYQEPFNTLRSVLDEACPVFDGYIKGLAVKELKFVLDNPDLSDEEAVKTFEAQLKGNPETMKILTKNRQSQCEYMLKLFSVFSILIGVGIFTTLGLIFKRLYDSNGSSINFFKPLSTNLTEDLADITANIKRAPTH